MRRLEATARFSALYSDHVYMEAFVDQYDVALERGWASVAETRDAIMDDLELLTSVRPLIECGILRLVSIPIVYCPSCLVGRSMGKATSKRFDLAFADFSKRLSKQLEICVVLEDGFLEYEVSGLDEFACQSRLSGELEELPRFIFNSPANLSKLESGNKVKVPRRSSLFKELLTDVARNFPQNLYVHITTSERANSRLLTNNPGEVALLNSLSANRRVVKSNEMLQRHLSTAIPWIDGVPVSEIIKIRTSEVEIHSIFQSFLDEVLAEAKPDGRALEKHRLQKIRDEIVTPGIARIELQMKDSIRFARRRTWNASVILLGAISFGFWSGLFPQGINHALGAYGVVKAANVMVNAREERLRVRNNMRSDKMYFLWQLKKIADRPR